MDNRRIPLERDRKSFAFRLSSLPASLLKRDAACIQMDVVRKGRRWSLSTSFACLLVRLEGARKLLVIHFLGRPDACHSSERIFLVSYIQCIRSSSNPMSVDHGFSFSREMKTSPSCTYSTRLLFTMRQVSGARHNLPVWVLPYIPELVRNVALWLLWPAKLPNTSRS